VTTPLDLSPKAKAGLKVVLVTPETAALWLERNVHNRRLRQPKVDEMSRDMAAHRWGFAADPIRFDWNGNLIDGQHRLHAVIKSGTSQPMVLATGLDPQVMHVIDTGAKRSSGDAFALDGDRDAVHLAAAVRLAKGYVEGTLRTNSVHSPAASTPELVAFRDANPELRQAVALARSWSSLQRLFHPSVLAVGWWVLSGRDVDRAAEFFEAMLNNSTNGHGDPRNTLLNKMQQAIRAGRRKPKPGEQLTYLFIAWNRWRDGKSLTKFAALPANIPEPR
jgi:hypothetical protein